MRDGETEGLKPLETQRFRMVCPACESGHVTVAFKRSQWAAFAATTEGKRQAAAAAMDADPRLAFDDFLRCETCGTIFADWVPSDEALGAFYQSFYVGSAFNKLKIKLGLETRRIFALKFLVRGRRFLDVGSSIGCAVEGARKNGFEATGLELDEVTVELARKQFPKNTFVASTLERFQPERGFDLVQCVEVLEHVPDGRRFVADLARMVAPGGMLLLTTPDSSHRKAGPEIMKWGMVCPPEHITLFSRAGVRTMLDRHFDRVIILPNAKPGVQALAFKARA